MCFIMRLMSDEENPIDPGSISLLIPESRNGQKSAREELFSALKGYLESTAARQVDGSLKRKAGASDIVQASFLKIIENFESFRGETSAELKAWIKTIVRNEANQLRRSFQSEKRDINREILISPPGASSAPPLTPADANLTPSSDAVKAEQNQRFHEILEELSADNAEVIRLRNIESLSFLEIGERMNRTEQAASQLWYRAILKFEEKLKAAGLGED